MPQRPEQPLGPTIRAFVAINLDPGLKESIAVVQERLKSARADVGWVKPENLHLTLKFLGQVPGAYLEAIAEAVESAAVGYGAFRLAFAGLGAFPQPRSARVIWIGVREGAQGLAGLQARLEAELQPLGFPPETRPFAAHLTLGRVRGPGRREQLAAVLTSLPTEPLGEMVLDRIELMKSDLRPDGARYSALRSFPLGGPP
ncbi:MAG: RNA 2',3'-cyclic phosphodiesterase [Candidatus Methylomirabilis sp.]